jgi:hypothetical protein
LNSVLRKSRLKRLYSRRLARQLAEASGKQRAHLEALAEHEARDEIARQRDKGWELVTRLDTGEGVFVRDDDVVGLHIQLPSALYRRLDTESARRETTKRQMVIVALERYLKET